MPTSPRDGKKNSKERKESKSWLNTNPGAPCKLRNSSFTNSKRKKGKRTQLVLPLCLLSTPFLGHFSCTAGGGRHRELQGLQREQEKRPFKSAQSAQFETLHKRETTNAVFKGGGKQPQPSKCCKGPSIGSFRLILYLLKFRFLLLSL